ncbi:MULTISPECIES: tRNA-dihydrouridine synthase family protein [unclassified Fibrobacter]|uniref:tRNA-dihydrouridine synthase family protein n=1 Tax=unclassified Fibrobacter TaxID=2634177 RepID=UPI000D6D5618|nr:MULTISPECIES: tRNA-dihydrouridine synthase family protein [unclassified Fibrobacter]PWJ67054.1 tRNA-dihydrouridine synthase [Fibrobacter sp. UWR4]PZW70621.1 tRNA-dihydrouridine synthase [Fibrobacter sp. UWR1]
MKPIYFAPLQGFTECAYRQAHFSYVGGVDAYYTPFLRVEKGEARAKELRDLQQDLEFIRSRQSNVCHCENQGYQSCDDETNHFYNVIPQVICRDVHEFRILVDAIQKLKQDCGFAPDEVFPQIDINMGCPFPMQAKSGRGSGILPRTDAVKEILQEVKRHSERSDIELSATCCPTILRFKGAESSPKISDAERPQHDSMDVHQHDLRFSVKMRLGYTSPDECLALLPLLNEAPLAHITMHPRTGIQQYKGALDFTAFEKFYEGCKHPIIFNGDITSIKDIQAIACRFPNLKGIMIGRGLLANPALATQYQDGSKNTGNPIPALIKIHDALLADYRKRLQGDAQILDKIRPFWTYAVLEKRTIKKIAKARKLSDYLDAVNEISFPSK